MIYKYSQIESAHKNLKARFESLEDKKQIFKDKQLKELFGEIRNINPDERSGFGAEINKLKNEIQKWVEDSQVYSDNRGPIDVTAPFDTNVTTKPKLFRANSGGIHPLTAEINYILDIFYRMGFNALESRQIDDDFHMFESLNFPEGHPARDDYDTFMTTEGFIAPAHTSTMQNRALVKYKDNLEKGEPIAVVVPDRVFRNEDLDATHEHTFYQVEGIYVNKGVNVGNLIAVLREFMSEYFGQELKAKIQPFYFPFTEPSFEFAIERPDVLRKDDSEDQKWLELLGCGMIHPNVLKMAGIDPVKYTGFAWGNGIERMVMMKYGVEDVRHFESANLKFLRQFS